MGQKTKCKRCGLIVEGQESGDKMRYSCSCGNKWTGQNRPFQGNKSGNLGKIVGAGLGVFTGGLGGVLLGGIVGSLFDEKTPMTCRRCQGNGYPTDNIQNNRQQYQCESCRTYWWRTKK